MNKNNVKKVLGVVVPALIAMEMITGCGKGAENGTQANSQGGQVASSGQENQVEEPFKVSVMLQDFEGSPVSGEHSEEVLNKLEEYTNCDVEFVWTPSDTYQDKLGITLAQGDDMPMIMQVDSYANVLAAAKAGAFWDLTEYIKDAEKYPNLSQANPNVNKAMTVDGKLIGIYRTRPLGRNGWGYRQDWADKLGLSEPKTVEDLYNMMYQFTYGDPDGNGVDDTYGLDLCKYMGPFDIMQTWFGCGNQWVEKDGNLVPVHQTEEYKEALDWFRKMYEDGLVYSDFAVRDTTTWLDGMYNGECGVYIDLIGNAKKVWEYFNTNEIPAVTGDGFASMKLMTGLAKDENSDPKSLATTGFGGYFVITKAAKTEEDVEKCLEFLDKIGDNEMQLLTGYGLEGIHWEEDENGEMVRLNLEDKNFHKAYAGLNQLGNVVTGTNPPLKQSEIQKLATDLEKEAEDIVVFNPAIGYINNSAEYSMNGAVLDAVLSEARTKYIVGQIDEEGLKKAWEEWSAKGGDKLIQEINDMYHADQNK